ncbi:MAG TPA: alpha-glucan family phosphorylase [Acidimicrobiales bacterium]|nr:alpha-glucan family phosphorylase [Acidimicrobiales bacterium]
MRALHSFTVRPTLPRELTALAPLAMNLRWSWDERTRDLFRWLDPVAWADTDGDPVAVLGRVGRDRLEMLADDAAFKAFLGEVASDLQRYLSTDLWFQTRRDSALRAVAYFSPEFGISEALPQYSGGLGVLAGDHLKAASDLGVPLVGVGLMYRQGYFRQTLDPDGWQQERYPDLDPHAMALQATDVRITVDLAGTELVAGVWRADVGRVKLYLLDSHVDPNEPAEASVTDRLYGGNTEHRLRQEILLGMGGVRALTALDEEVQVFHSNEGHAGFLGLERIRTHVVDDGLSFDEALEAVRAASVFTTHTPVPAGIDRFPAELMVRYFSDWAEQCGIGIERLLALGHEPGEPTDSPFNMAVMGLRLSGRANGVSRLHGRVSRSMFSSLWPGLPTEEVPISSVTNGVHGATWVSPEMSNLLTRHVQPAWSEAPAAAWERIEQISDHELWRVREQGRDHLVTTVRARLRDTLTRKGFGDPEIGWTDEVLDPSVLTIGFARRFATYKRAALLLSDPDRLKAMLLSPDRPVQLVFAGKAHPADGPGKELIREVARFCADPELRHRVAFVEDYDMALARSLVQGCDVWLNTPRRPLEACGTSGLKACLNGALNLSILDGWWDECFDGSNGWAISSAEGEFDVASRDAAEAANLFATLERQVVPLFYDRGDGVIPRRWVGRVKRSLTTLGPFAVATRMLRDYVEDVYEPASARAGEMTASRFAEAKRVAAWKAKVRGGWGTVSIRTVSPPPAATTLGEAHPVQAVIDLGSLDIDDVSVEVLHGHVGQDLELVHPAHEVMKPVAAEGGAQVFAGEFVCSMAGRYGFTVRVVPARGDHPWPTDLGHTIWA